jgi:hypothetical protein
MLSEKEKARHETLSGGPLSRLLELNPWVKICLAQGDK